MPGTGLDQSVAAGTLDVQLPNFILNPIHTMSKKLNTPPHKFLKAFRVGKQKSVQLLLVRDYTSDSFRNEVPK
jgi:hypothetical protein